MEEKNKPKTHQTLKWIIDFFSKEVLAVEPIDKWKRTNQ